jgi:hypothetical protein
MKSKKDIDKSVAAMSVIQDQLIVTLRDYPPAEGVSTCLSIGMRGMKMLGDTKAEAIAKLLAVIDIIYDGYIDDEAANSTKH